MSKRDDFDRMLPWSTRMWCTRNQTIVSATTPHSSPYYLCPLENDIKIKNNLSMIQNQPSMKTEAWVAAFVSTVVKNIFKNCKKLLMLLFAIFLLDILFMLKQDNFCSRFRNWIYRKPKTLILNGLLITGERPFTNKP